MRLLLSWILSALAVWIVSRIVPGIYVSGPIAALVAALVIGFINATLGALLQILTFPLTLLTLGIFWFVINALMLELASALLAPKFQVRTFTAAFIGAIVLSLVNMVLKWLVNPTSDRE
jgi:putative membrane protein